MHIEIVTAVIGMRKWEIAKRGMNFGALADLEIGDPIARRPRSNVLFVRSEFGR